MENPGKRTNTATEALTEEVKHKHTFHGKLTIECPSHVPNKSDKQCLLMLAELLKVLQTRDKTACIIYTPKTGEMAYTLKDLPKEWIILLQLVEL